MLIPTNKRVYLSIPYTFNPELSFDIANRVAGMLMDLGNVVFSPVSHGHAIAPHIAKHNVVSHDFWMKQDLPMIDWCEVVALVYVGENGKELVEQSKGCTEELELARKQGKPIVIIKATKNNEIESA